MDRCICHVISESLPARWGKRTARIHLPSKKKNQPIRSKNILAAVGLESLE